MMRMMGEKSEKSDSKPQSKKYKLERAKSSLTSLHSRAGAQRVRITWRLLILGSLLFPPGILLGLMRASGILSFWWGHDGFYFAFSLPGLYLLLVAIVPNDHFYIQLAWHIATLFCFGSACLLVLMVMMAALGFDGEAERDCSPEYTRGCVAFMLHWGAVSTICVVTFVMMLASFLREKVTPRVRLRRTCGGRGAAGGPRGARATQSAQRAGRTADGDAPP